MNSLNAEQGFVYVQSNETDHNHLLAFQRAADGTLSQAGAYSTGGEGDGIVHLTSQGSVTLTGDGAYVLITNAASGNLSIFTIRANGVELAKVIETGAK